MSAAPGALFMWQPTHPPLSKASVPMEMMDSPRTGSLHRSTVHLHVLGD